MYISKLIARNPPPRRAFLFVWLPNKEPGGRGPVLFLRALHLETTHTGKPPGAGGSFDQKMCTCTHTHTHTHTNSICKYIKLTYTHIRKQRTMLPSHQHILFVTHSNIRPLLPFRAVHAICLYECRRTARIHELAEASHKQIFEPHSSTLAVANHTAPPTYVIDKNM